MQKIRVSRNTLAVVATSAGVIALMAGAGLAIDVLRELSAVFIIHQGVRILNHVRTVNAERKGEAAPPPISVD